MSLNTGGDMPLICRLALLLPLLCLGGAVRADSDGVPALLQFAEQYRNQQPATKDTPPMGKRSQTSQLDARPKDERRQTLNQQAALREQEKQLAILRQQLKEADAKLKSLSKAPAARGTIHAPIDVAPLQQLLSGLRKAASAPPDAKRARELIAQARQQAEQERIALTNSQAREALLQAQLNDLKNQLQTGGKDISREQQLRQDLRSQLDNVQTKLDEKSKALATLQLSDKMQAEAREEQNKILTNLKSEHNTLKTMHHAQMLRLEQTERERNSLLADKQTLQNEYGNLQQQLQTTDTLHAEQNQTLAQLETDNKALRERATWLAKPENLTRPETRQAYAAGSALGRDIISMLDERKAWGVNADRQIVLSGVIDAFSGHYQLSPDVLSAALTESENVVNNARKQTSLMQQKMGETFVDNFKKQKGVKQSPSGFWYRVDYVGDTPIAKEAVVGIVVKESMTDGTVIQDMDVSGNMLSQPLNAYPPLFREAIGHLRNHGALTMVVPPSLAYGEAGYPPNVPPNATMVYMLRIENTEAASDK